MSYLSAPHPERRPKTIPDDFSAQSLCSGVVTAAAGRQRMAYRFSSAVIGSPPDGLERSGASARDSPALPPSVFWPPRARAAER